MAKTGGANALKLLVAAVGVAAIVYAFLPKPVPVETAKVTRGKMQVTIDEQGLTGIRTKFLVATPLPGRMERMTWRPGDTVEVGTTVLAMIFPADLDPRNRTQAEARRQTAEMNLKRSQTLHTSAKRALDFAQSELKRVQTLFDADRRLINRDELDRAIQMERVRTDEEKAAGYAEEIAKIELAAAKASLGEPSPEAAAGDVFEIKAPVSGKVLRVLRQDAGVVAAGTPLVELGDPKDLEIHVNVLSTEATRIRKDASVIVEGWGGDQKLEAKVRQVEPAAVTGVSPLGVAEQRVRVIVEFDKQTTDIPLGDNFSVQVRIVEWESAEAVQVPTSALVGSKDNRSVFRIENGKAVRRAVKTGHENSRVAEVLEGLSPGDTVVAYPGDRVADGVQVAPIK